MADNSLNSVNYDLLQVINLLRGDCLELHLTELRIVDVIYSHLRLHYDVSVNVIVDNMITYYEIEEVPNFPDVERYLTGLSNLTSTSNPITIYGESSDEDTPEDYHDMYDHIDDVILENGHNNIRFTRVMVNSRFIPGTSPPSTSASPPTRGNRFEDVKVILQKKELDKHTTLKYKNVASDLKTAHPRCSVCMEEFTETALVRRMQCNHVFHKKCIDKWLLEYNYKCPMCRTECGKYEPKL
jgi:hypothetical protein